MKIAVIAANGRSGKAFVEQALAGGHFVRAGVYKTNTITKHPNLVVVECDATSQDDLTNLIQDQDVVVSFIGHVKGSPAHVQTDAVRALVVAMKKQNITRLVSLTGTGVRFPGDKITLMDRVLNASISVIDPARIKDGRDHVSFLQQTDLDWTVLRVLKLQNIALKPYVLRQNGPTKLFVGRSEVAKAALEVIEQKSFIKQAPIISPSR